MFMFSADMPFAPSFARHMPDGSLFPFPRIYRYTSYLVRHTSKKCFRNIADILNLEYDVAFIYPSFMAAVARLALYILEGYEAGAERIVRAN